MGEKSLIVWTNIHTKISNPDIRPDVRPDNRIEFKLSPVLYINIINTSSKFQRNRLNLRKIHPAGYPDFHQNALRLQQLTVILSPGNLMLLAITVLEISSGQTDKQTNATENSTSPISSAEVTRPNPDTNPENPMLLAFFRC